MDKVALYRKFIRAIEDTDVYLKEVTTKITLTLPRTFQPFIFLLLCLCLTNCDMPPTPPSTAGVSLTVTSSPAPGPQATNMLLPTAKLEETAPAEALAVMQTIAGICTCQMGECGQVVVEGDLSYSFSCPISAGHAVRVTMTHFATVSDARAAFDEARSGMSVECFHGYPAAYERHEEGSLPWTVDQHYWQAGRWFISTTSRNDTHYTYALSTSEAIYKSALPQRIFPPGTCGGTPTPTGPSLN